MESDALNPAAHRDVTLTSVTGSAARSSPQARVVRRRKQRRVTHENRVLYLSLAAGLAAVITSMVLLWTGDFASHVQWTLTVLIVGAWLGFSFGVRAAVIRPLQTLANMQSALREGDFSVRVRGASTEDALGELMLEINAMSEVLREQRLGAMEASEMLGWGMSWCGV